MVAEELYDVLSPLLAAAGLDLYDLQVGQGTVTVTVDRVGGIDLESLAQANRLVSDALDAAPPFADRYTLEVSSPGLERRLRTPEHFARAVGETLSVRTHPGSGRPRRVRGRLAVGDDRGIVLTGTEVPGGELRLDYEDIERARTVFEWGSERAPSPSRGARSRQAAKLDNPDAPTERVTTP